MKLINTKIIKWRSFKRFTAYITFISNSRNKVTRIATDKNTNHNDNNNKLIITINWSLAVITINWSYAKNTKAFGRIQLRVSNPSMMFSMKDNIERITIRKRKYFHTYKDLRADSASRKQSINDVLYVKQNIERTTIRKRKYSHKKFMI